MKLYKPITLTLVLSVLGAKCVSATEMKTYIMPTTTDNTINQDALTSDLVAELNAAKASMSNALPRKIKRDTSETLASIKDELFYLDMDKDGGLILASNKGVK